MKSKTASARCVRLANGLHGNGSRALAIVNRRLCVSRWRCVGVRGERGYQRGFTSAFKPGMLPS